jgi:hypothetical protein
MDASPTARLQSPARKVGSILYRRKLVLMNFSEDLYPQTTRTGIWLRNTALKSFTMCRSPRTGCDDMLQIPSHSLDEPQKVLVMVYDWFYVIDVYHSAPSSTAPNHSSPMPLVDDVSDLEERLRAVVVDAQARRQRGERAVPVGLLSADNRDVWAKVHLCSRFIAASYLTTANRTLTTFSSSRRPTSPFSVLFSTLSWRSASTTGHTHIYPLVTTLPIHQSSLLALPRTTSMLTSTTRAHPMPLGTGGSTRRSLSSSRQQHARESWASIRPSTRSCRAWLASTPSSNRSTPLPLHHPSLRRSRTFRLHACHRMGGPGWTGSWTSIFGGSASSPGSVRGTLSTIQTTASCGSQTTVPTGSKHVCRGCLVVTYEC